MLGRSRRSSPLRGSPNARVHRNAVAALTLSLLAHLARVTGETWCFVLQPGCAISTLAPVGLCGKAYRCFVSVNAASPSLDAGESQGDTDSDPRGP